MSETQHYGTWTTDAAALPCFDLVVGDRQAPESAFRHLISTGRVSAMADRWGNVNLFTTEGGFLWLNSPTSSYARSSLYMTMEVDGEPISLLYSELTKREKIRVGVGYIEYVGEVNWRGARFRITQQVFALPDRGCSLQGHFTLTNLGARDEKLSLEIRGDVIPTRTDSGGDRPTMHRRFLTESNCAIFPEIEGLPGGVFLAAADSSWAPSACRCTLRLTRELVLAAGESVSAECATGYNRKSYSSFVPLAEARRQWSRKLAPFAAEAPEAWMKQECLWAIGQLLSFECYDSSVKEFYLALGGYAWSAFPVREVSETSMVLASGNWDLTAASLRFVAKTQLTNGDIPKIHNMRRDRSSTEFESDNEIWFVLGCCESVNQTGQFDFLDELCSFWNGEKASIWEHLKRAFYWVRDGIGRGGHGLILIRDGDWNDYLSLVGAEGRGESVANSGMACRAFSLLAALARHRDDLLFAAELETYVEELRNAVALAFDGDWFVGGYTDDGTPIGSLAEDRLFLNSQTWASLGRCGTPDQRRRGLLRAVEKCHTEIGLMLMSRPYSSPAPDSISWCAIPAGDGENAGIWPQTVFWAVWALAEEGLLEEAIAEWKCGTLRNHARIFPDVPFGIFNGPDCYSSVWAGRREGLTQRQLLNRAQYAPMNPVIAWQGFALQKIAHAARRQETSPVARRRNDESSLSATAVD
jgi:hypothetical protein